MNTETELNIGITLNDDVEFQLPNGEWIPFESLKVYESKTQRYYSLEELHSIRYNKENKISQKRLQEIAEKRGLTKNKMSNEEDDLNINDIVCFNRKPDYYSGVHPFSATIHHIEELTIQERSVIQDALVNAGVKIKIMRGLENEQTFKRK